MISMQGVPSSLIASNESWVRKQAASLVRNLPANVEKADLIQVGLIAVAQASLAFQWEGDRDTDEARDAFVRHARLRVKGAMLDELRQMDHLCRSQRRKVKVIQIARERWRSAHGVQPSLSQLSELCGLDVEEICDLEHADAQGRAQSHGGSDGGDGDEGPAREARPLATAQDEVEARVDTAIVLRRLERFFAQLPERERLIIDAYMGVGLTPTELAASLKLSLSRVSQVYSRVLDRIADHFGHDLGKNGPDGAGASDFGALVTQREEALQHMPGHGPWGLLMEEVLTAPLPPSREKQD